MAKAAASANSVLGRINDTFTCLEKEILLHLYTSMVRPWLEFTVQAWSPYTRREINVLESVQRRATKLVPALTHFPYQDRLSNLGLTTLEARRRRGDMIETFKILKGYVHTVLSKLLNFFIKNVNKWKISSALINYAFGIFTSKCIIC